jgi:DNA uptake protein ComE-like DNA-binding protein
MCKLFVVLFALFALTACTQETPVDERKAKPVAQKSPQEKRDADKLDINSATEEELAALQGIGEQRAKAIIRGRPWGAKDELVDRGVLPEVTYDNIKGEIIARQRK